MAKGRALMMDSGAEHRNQYKKGKEKTGLGLSIVYTIIENHKGTIKVDSEDQKGTVFTINLPINQN